MKRSPLRRVSVKRAASLRELAKARTVVIERAHGRCEASFSPHCAGVGHHAHHVLRRSQGGPNTPENLLWTCAACHGLIHAEPERAMRAGYLRSKMLAKEEA